jgi:amidohydrolase
VWAGSDLLEIEVVGEKTHGAYPHTGVDAALTASQIVVALQSVVSRNIDARDACVISVGRIESGESYNIIAERAKLTGTMRTLSESIAEDAKVAVRRVVEGVAAAMGARAEVSWTPGARPTINDVDLERRVVASLRERLGDDRVVAHAPQMGAEDFASFSRRVPACYLFLGVRNEERGITHMIHTPRFDVDERCLPLAVGAFTETLLELARERSAR